MKTRVIEKLASLPRLNRGVTQSISCKICGGRSKFFDVVDFNKVCSADMYEFGHSGVFVEYFRCESCGFVFTPFFDDWGPEDFSRFIYNEDYIFVDGEYLGTRPRREAGEIAELLSGQRELRVLDFGSGSGQFEKELRELGYQNISSYDPFSATSRPEGIFDVITCFEVLEHTPTPKETMANITEFFGPGACLIISTGIQPENISVIRASWWYIAPRNGHVSIYTLDALGLLGEEFGLSMYAGERGIVFSKRQSSQSNHSDAIIARLGLPRRVLFLGAPEREAHIPTFQQGVWHNVEHYQSVDYRWTREAVINWRIQTEPLGPCLLILKIGIVHEIYTGFASQCRVAIGNVSVPLERHATELSATVRIEEPTEPIIRLITPFPVRPSDVNGADDTRLLGLGIATRSLPTETTLISQENPAQASEPLYSVEKRRYTAEAREFAGVWLHNRSRDATQRSSFQEEQCSWLRLVANIHDQGEIFTDMNGWTGLPASKLAVEGFAIVDTGDIPEDALTYRVLLEDQTLSDPASVGDYVRSKSKKVIGFQITVKESFLHAMDVIYEATFIDGTWSGNVESGAICRSILGAPVEAMRVLIIDKEGFVGDHIRETDVF